MGLDSAWHGDHKERDKKVLRSSERICKKLRCPAGLTRPSAGSKPWLSFGAPPFALKPRGNQLHQRLSTNTAETI